LVKEAGLLQGAERAKDGVEQEQEDQGARMVEVEFAIARLVALTADVVESVEKRQ
jgi:hypothetical protein